jgi:hypothetical protein
MQWVAPEVRLEHQDIYVYFTYKNDDIETSGPYTYQFTLNEYFVEGGPDSFDVRDLPAWKETDEGAGPWMTVDDIITLTLRKSIESGDLKEIPALI